MKHNQPIYLVIPINQFSHINKLSIILKLEQIYQTTFLQAFCPNSKIYPSLYLRFLLYKVIILFCKLMKIISKTIFSILLFLALISSFQTRQVNVRNLKFYDKLNRQLTLHGTNAVVKVPPYHPSTGAYDPVWSFGPEDIKNLRDNGFNALRLGLMWAGLQPKKDWYNQTYLAEMIKIVNMAGQAGIYSIIDFHQDLLSQKFCGDGVPIWLMDELKGYKTFPFPMGKKIHLNGSGLPDWKDCDQANWGKYYFSYDVGQGFNDLYNPNHKLNHKFNQFWHKLATAFKDNPYVVAYELINEPFIGNFWRNPTLVIPSMGQRVKLQSFYDQLSQTIRNVDDQTPLCFEPVTFDNFVPTGFSHPPGGNKYRNMSIFCYHHYQPPALSLKSLDTYVKDGVKLGVASMLSQTHGETEVLERAQFWKQSWMYWQYKDFGKTWGMSAGKNTPNLDQILQSKQVGQDVHLVRTYMPKVAGELEQSKFNVSTWHYSGTYFAQKGGESILFLAKYRGYNNNYQINVYPENETQVIQDESNYVTIKYKGSEANKRILVTVSKI